jgi:hypothetical protein
MKQLSTLAVFFCILFSFNANSQCTSGASSYDLVVFNNTTFPPSASQPYTQAYVCWGGVLTDSAQCCTRICHVDSGGTFIAGPVAYGGLYLKNGATFDGQNTSMTWVIFAEPGAIILNYSGNVQQCPTVTFPAALCFMSTPEAYMPAVGVSQNGNQLSFLYADVLAKATVELYDATGKLVQTSTQAQSDRQDVDVSALPAGIYMYRVMDGETLIGTDKVLIVK